MQATTPPSNSDKSAWRRWLKERLRQIPRPDQASAAIRSHLEAALAGSAPLKICTFAPLPSEPDLIPAAWAGTGHRWHFPRVTGETLAFHEVADPSGLDTGAYGIREPSSGAGAVPVDRFDWILCPGLGFGRDGSRLGRGKGYYDRTLAEARPDALKIGVAFTEQLVDALPCDPHDRRMTHLLTPAGFFEVGEI